MYVCVCARARARIGVVQPHACPPACLPASCLPASCLPASLPVCPTCLKTQVANYWRLALVPVGLCLDHAYPPPPPLPQPSLLAAFFPPSTSLATLSSTPLILPLVRSVLAVLPLFPLLLPVLASCGRGPRGAIPRSAASMQYRHSPCAATQERDTEKPGAGGNGIVTLGFGTCLRTLKCMLSRARAHRTRVQADEAVCGQGGSSCGLCPLRCWPQLTVS